MVHLPIIDTCINNVLFKAQKKGRMFQERSENGLFSLKRQAMMPSRSHQGLDSEKRFIGHGICLQVTPDVFRWIQLRSIRLQEHRTPIFFPGDVVLDEAGPMGHEPIPEQGDGTLKMPAEVLQEGKDLAGVDIGLGMKAEKQLSTVSAGRDGQSGDDGNFPVGVGPMLEQGRLAARRPTSSHQRHHQEAAFVKKNESGAYPSGVFFTLGQSALTQFWMAASSRSTARRCGFWGLQPRECKTRPIWST